MTGGDGFVWGEEPCGVLIGEAGDDGHGQRLFWGEQRGGVLSRIVFTIENFINALHPRVYVVDDGVLSDEQLIQIGGQEECFECVKSLINFWCPRRTC